ncbi:MAG: hypothetical protein GY726_00055 [Proteobacteria bacterium]|nr:hypothetical protein [Pseudomonadota bacterium]
MKRFYRLFEISGAVHLSEDKGLLFTFFWGVQSALVYYGFGLKWTIAYFVVLTISTTLAMKMRGRHGQNLEDVRVFFALMGKNDFKRYLLEKWPDIEV